MIATAAALRGGAGRSYSLAGPMWIVAGIAALLLGAWLVNRALERRNAEHLRRLPLDDVLAMVDDRVRASAPAAGLELLLARRDPAIVPALRARLLAPAMLPEHRALAIRVLFQQGVPERELAPLILELPANAVRAAAEAPVTEISAGLWEQLAKRFAAVAERELLDVHADDIDYRARAESSRRRDDYLATAAACHARARGELPATVGAGTVGPWAGGRGVGCTGAGAGCATYGGVMLLGTAFAIARNALGIPSQEALVPWALLPALAVGLGVNVVKRHRARSVPRADEPL